MKRSDFPLRNALRSEDDEHALQRMWQGIDAQTVEKARTRRLPLWGLGAAGMVAAAVVLLVWWQHDAGPLRMADGQAVAPVSAPPAGVSLPLSDGSVIALSAGARFEPLESTSSTFLAVLQSGRGDFDIRPGGPRRWQVECGLATVEVLGTRFSCARGPGRLDVTVERGVVLVRGERVPDRAQRLTAGQTMTVLEAPAEAPTADLERGKQEVGAVTVASPLERGARAETSPRGRATVLAPASDNEESAPWRALAKAGHHREAFSTLGPQGVRRASRTSGVAGLLTLADVARLSGHPKDAVAPLERLLRDFSADPQAPLAAVELGRLELDALGHSMAAVIAFERALSLGVPSSLKEDVQVRLVEAYEKAGDRERARVLGESYLRAHPAGRYRRVIEARLSRLP